MTSEFRTMMIEAGLGHLKYPNAAERKAKKVARYVSAWCYRFESGTTATNVAAYLWWSVETARSYLRLAERMGLVRCNDSVRPHRWYDLRQQ